MVRVGVRHEGPAGPKDPTTAAKVHTAAPRQRLDGDGESRLRVDPFGRDLRTSREEQVIGRAGAGTDRPTVRHQVE